MVVLHDTKKKTANLIDVLSLSLSAVCVRAVCVCVCILHNLHTPAATQQDPGWTSEIGGRSSQWWCESLVKVPRVFFSLFLRRKQEMAVSMNAILLYNMHAQYNVSLLLFWMYAAGLGRTDQHPRGGGLRDNMRSDWFVA